MPLTVGADDAIAGEGAREAAAREGPLVGEGGRHRVPAAAECSIAPDQSFEFEHRYGEYATMDACLSWLLN